MTPEENKARKSKWWQENKHRYNSKERERKKMLRYYYGLTEEDYKRMWIDQNGCCAICGKYQFELKRGLDVDHCHTTEKVRGLLCSNCNRAIGYFKDNIASLEAAIAYLKKHTS